MTAPQPSVEQRATPERTRQRLPAGDVVALALLAVAVGLAVLVAPRWHLLQARDDAIETSVHRFVLAHAWLGDTAHACTHAGDPVVVTVASAVLAAALALRRWYAAALYVVVVRLVAMVVSSGVKVLVDRPRPDLPHPLAIAHTASFPSGHALGSAALWGSAAVLLAAAGVGRWLTLAVAVVVPVLVAATRVLLGVHFVTDVTAGLALGWAVALLAARVARRGATGVP